MKKGFTIIELVVSIGIIAILGLTVSQIFVSTIRTNTKTEILKEVKQNGEFAMEVMVRMIQNAEKVVSVCDGSDQQAITILNQDGYETTFGCAAVGSPVIYRVASISATSTQYISSSNVTLGGGSCATSSLHFICSNALGLPNTVVVKMDLAQSGVSPDQFEQSSASFQTSVNTRNVPLY